MSFFHSNTRSDEGAKVIDATYEAAEDFGFGYGCDVVFLSDKQILSLLLEYKMIAFSDGEYSHFIVHEKLREDD